MQDEARRCHADVAWAVVVSRLNLRCVVQRQFFSRWVWGIGGPRFTMGKRAEARPEISSRLLAMVDEAKTSLGQSVQASIRPQASPARGRKGCEGLVMAEQGTPTPATDLKHSPAAVVAVV